MLKLSLSQRLMAGWLVLALLAALLVGVLAPVLTPFLAAAVLA